MNYYAQRELHYDITTMITVKTLQELFDYNYWANTKLFDVLVSVTPQEFTQTLGGSYGSIRNTLVHIVSAEAGWMERCGGPKRGPRLTSAWSGLAITVPLSVVAWASRSSATFDAFGSRQRLIVFAKYMNEDTYAH